MILNFTDSSALTKLFVRENGSDALIQHVSALQQHERVLSALTVLEVRSAIRRRERSGDLAIRDSAMALNRFEELCDRSTVISLTPDIFDLATDLVDRALLKSLDALQLATALVVEQRTNHKVLFVAADLALLKAAHNEGLQTWSPEEPLVQ